MLLSLQPFTPPHPGFRATAKDVDVHFTRDPRDHSRACILPERPARAGIYFLGMPSHGAQPELRPSQSANPGVLKEIHRGVDDRPPPVVSFQNRQEFARLTADGAATGTQTTGTRSRGPFHIQHMWQRRPARHVLDKPRRLLLRWSAKIVVMISAPRDASARRTGAMRVKQRVRQIPTLGGFDKRKADPGPPRLLPVDAGLPT